MLLGDLFPAQRQMQESIFTGAIGNLLRVLHTLNGALVVIHHLAASSKYYRQPRVINAKGAQSFPGEYLFRFQLRSRFEARSQDAENQLE
jgi:hypothetical protein